MGVQIIVVTELGLCNLYDIFQMQWMWVCHLDVHVMAVAQHMCHQEKIVCIFEELVKQFVRPHDIYMMSWIYFQIMRFSLIKNWITNIISSQ